MSEALSQKISEVGLQEFARRCGVTYQAVRKWQKHGIPPVRACQVHEAFGVPLSKLRPDLWPAGQAHDDAA